MAFFLLLLFFLPLASVHADEVTAFVFTTPSSFSLAEHTAISVQSQSTAGEKTNVVQTTCLRFTTSSATGLFSASATSWEPLAALTVTMSKNSANRTVYYAETTQGTYTLSVRAAGKPPEETRSCASWPIAEWPAGLSATQQITAGTPASEETVATSTPPLLSDSLSSAAPATAASGGGGGISPPSPQITVYAKVPFGAVAGADAVFEAAAFGLKKEPLPNARFVWSFGDGATAEGKKVYHAYHLPASYVVLVEASSSEWGATDRADITVTAPQISLGRVQTGADGFIEVKNNGADDLDLSRWFLRSGSLFFPFPNGTILKKGSAVPFAAAITKLVAVGNDVALLYPNGTEAVRYTPVILPVEQEQKNIKVEPRDDIKVEPRGEVQPLVFQEERATTTEFVASVGATESGSSSTFAWVGLAFGIAVLGACGYLWSVRQKSAPPPEAAYEITE